MFSITIMSYYYSGKTGDVAWQSATITFGDKKRRRNKACKKAQPSNIFLTLNSKSSENKSKLLNLASKEKKIPDKISDYWCWYHYSI